MRKAAVLFVLLVWSQAALAHVPVEYIIVANNPDASNGTEHGNASYPKGISYLSMGKTNREVYVTYIDSDTETVFGAEVPPPPPNHGLQPKPFEVPLDPSLPLFACLWGDRVVFCQTEVKGQTPFEDAIVAWDYLAQRGSVYSFGSRRLMRPSGGVGAALRSAYGNWVVVEGDDHSIYLLTWDATSGQLTEDVVALGDGYDYSPVVGPGGGEFPRLPNTPVYVVYQYFDRNRKRYYLRSWDVDAKKVVSETDAGDDEPSPSQLYGFVFLETVYDPIAGFRNVMKWDPTEPPPNPDGPAHPPHPIQSIRFEPGYHWCKSLHELRVGPYFGVVRGKDCIDPYSLLPVDGQRISLVTRNSYGLSDHFVMGYPHLYQPFLVDSVAEVSEDFPLQYAILDEYFAYYDSVRGQVRVIKVKVDRLMPSHAPWTAEDDDSANPAALAPWNLGAWGSGSIDYAAGGRADHWKIFLSKEHDYVLYVFSADYSRCKLNAWDGHVTIDVKTESKKIVSGLDYKHCSVNDPEAPDECPAILLQPSQSEDYYLRIYRPIPGTPNVAPPLNYHISVVPQEKTPTVTCR